MDKKGLWAHTTGSHVIWKGKPLASVKKGSWAHTTGSHVIWKGKPLASVKKGSWAHTTGSHVIWKGKPLASVKKDRGLKVGENRGENAGSKVQSPSWAAGVTHIWSIYGFDMAQVQVGQRGKYKRG